MSDNNVIREKIKKKEGEISALEEKLKAAKVYLTALNDILRSLDKVVDEENVETLRPGSTIGLARRLILDSNSPLHINDILVKLDKSGTREARASLTSSLAAYVKRGEVFVRTGPNTFGLIELGHFPDSANNLEPPSDFG